MKSGKNKQQDPEKNLRNMKVALFCLAGILIFYFGANFLKGINAFGHKTYYYAIFDDIGGLQTGTSVNVNGYKIGKVNKIVLSSSNPVKICMEVLVTDKIPLPKDSQFEVTRADLLGGMVVNVIMGKAQGYAHTGDTMKSRVASSMLADWDIMQRQIQSILSSMDTIGLSVKQVFNPVESQSGSMLLKNTLINLEMTTDHLNKLLSSNSEIVNDIVIKFDRFSSTLDEAAPQLNVILENLNDISDSLAQANIHQLVQNAQSTVNNLNVIIDKLQKGEGSAGQLLNNDSLYLNLDETLESLNTLIQDIKENPDRYVHVSLFGGKNRNKK